VKARRVLLRVGALACLVVICAAPTPGDVGGCGQPRQALDEEVFFATKNAIECERCTECGLTTNRCTQACNADSGGRRFPEDCQPLVHDGEVCLRRPLDVGCDSFRASVDDRTPAVPSECEFCPEGAR